MQETTRARKKPRTPQELQKAVFIFTRDYWSTTASGIFRQCNMSYGTQNIFVEQQCNVKALLDLHGIRPRFPKARLKNMNQNTTSSELSEFRDILP